MKRFAAALCFLAFAEVGAADEAALARARQALADGVPQVAIHRLKDAPFSRERSLLLARSLLAADRAGEVEAALSTCPADDPEAQFWRAEALSALGHFPEALTLYTTASTSPDFAESALLGRTRMLVALHRVPEALALLEELPHHQPVSNRLLLDLARLQFDAEDYAAMEKTLDRLEAPAPAEHKEALYLAGRRSLALNQADAAEVAFASIEHPGPDLAAQRCLAQAETSLQRNDPANAEKVLEEFIENFPRQPSLDRVFAALDRLYARQGEVSSTEVRRWAEDREEPGRAALALFYQARNESRLSREDRSRQLYASFLETYPDHPLADAARLALATSWLQAGDAAAALRVAESGAEGGALDFLRGEGLALQGNYEQAAVRFRSAAATFESDRALYNSAFCALMAGLSDAKNPALAELGALPDGADWLKKLELAEALHLARNRDPRAGELLKRTWEKTGSARAALALAEWEYVQGEPAAARRQLMTVSSEDPGLAERKEGLEIFLQDTGDAEAETQVIALAQAFLTKYPDSAMEPEVRMKFGEMLFRRGDYLGARAQFDEVAQQFPDSSQAETAAFLSAQALSRSVDPKAMDESLELYNEVVNKGGPLALRARLEQGLLQYVLGRPREALVVLDRVLDSKPDADLRYTVLTAKGETLFSMGETDPTNYRQAIAVWQEISHDPKAPLVWRNQALRQAGAAYEKLGETDAALDSYYQALDPGKSDEPEYFWFYTAGFDAGRLLESQKLWNEAIVVYEKIAAQDGPRAQDAKDRVNQIRLENFLWE